MTITRRNYGNGHGYKDETGAKVPGVTTIIGDGFPKGFGIQKWAVGVTVDDILDHWDEYAAMLPSERRERAIKASDRKRDSAANRGTKTHKLADRLIEGERVEIPEALHGYVMAAKRFIDDFDAVSVCIEFVVYSETWRFAGTCDLIVDLLDPEDPTRRVRWLIDYKTKDKPQGVYGEAILQLAGYRFAERMVNPETGEDLPMIDVDRCGVVQLYPDGTYRLVPVEVGDAEFRTFQYVQQVGQWKADCRDLVGNAVDPPSQLPDGPTYQLTEIVRESEVAPW